MRLPLLLALLALAACAARPQAAEPTPLPTVAPAARGATLFVNKGCITCHENARVAAAYDGTIIGAGPNLSAYRSSEEFLQLWLRDPDAVRPGTAMPNLGLSDGEIADLIAFINAAP